ncbi:sporulation protein [Actinoplanes sp. NEAU-A12]|uniref:Sporulation protein n=1 Tax=Actinoplanes sandaracinus TaxID=3045177 RepID=A0ABT6WBW6_9ACTN|nr:sporulation protein [Actinoplanes sandaracinus]MDI6097194.1 sporulation protein [Actinoplanes sandaracinus]
MPSKLSASEILERAHTGTEAAVVGRVFGAPIERDGVTVVPVAVISGGGGGGGGGSGASPNPSPDGETPQGEGSGGGFGFSARPAGVYVIRNGDACWRPAVDVNKIVAGGQLIAIIALLVTRSIVRRRRR